MSRAFMTNLTVHEAIMLQKCVDEYKCTLTPDLDFFESESKQLGNIERKLANILRKEAEISFKNALTYSVSK